MKKISKDLFLVLHEYRVQYFDSKINSGNKAT